MTSRSATLTSFRQAAGQSMTLPELNAQFRAFTRCFGFTAYAVGFLPSKQGRADPFLLLDWPRAWLELYAREGFASEDAVVEAAFTASEAFTWTEVRERRPGASARIFAAARDFGWNDGLLVPVGSRAGAGADAERVGVASLAAPTLAGLDPVRRQDVVDACRLSFVRAVRLADGKPRLELTEREEQAMVLVANGRNDREIAAALGISMNTAHFHVEQAKRKLGAVTRAQAVGLAAAQGLLAGT